MTEQVFPAPLRLGGHPGAARAREGVPTHSGVPIHPGWEPDGGSSREFGRQIRSRALILWPGLDRTRLARTAGDPQRVARLVEGRTSLSSERIVSMLMAGDRD